MSAPIVHQQPPVDLSRCRNVPNVMIGVGVLLAIISAILSFTHDHGRQFGIAWLVGYMCIFSLIVGSLFLVIAHHLFDAGWSVPIRRINENICSLIFPWAWIFFIPIAILAPKMYSWMTANPATDEALRAKVPLFTMAGFYISTIVVLGGLSIIACGLRRWSVAQDKTGAAVCTFKMRKYSYAGIFLFAFLVTLGSILWMKGLEHQWFSTMYGVQYFAGSVWTTLAVVYVITMTLSHLNILRAVLHKHQFYYIGSLFFAFTVFYAYVSFAQYFIIWNANMPEETFWYQQREQGTWFWWSMIIIFGHFALPFLALLRIDVKENYKIMSFFAVWAVLMRFVDMCFNILPVASPGGVPVKLTIFAFGCAILMLGILVKAFLAKQASAAPYPLKDPRLGEAMGMQMYVPTPISGGEVEDVDDYEDSDTHREGGKA